MPAFIFPIHFAPVALEIIALGKEVTIKDDDESMCDFYLLLFGYSLYTRALRMQKHSKRSGAKRDNFVTVSSTSVHV